MALKIEKNYAWSFFRAGGVYQVNISKGSDIANIRSLDKKLWTALACPTKGIHFDSKTLAILDTDGDGRIRSPEVIDACEWACSLLKNPDELIKSSDSLPLDSIDDSSAEGKVVLQSARQILKDLSKEGATSISVADFASEEAIFAGTPFNADGVVTTLSAEGDETISKAIALVQKLNGSQKDRSGLDGINADSINAFFTKLAAYETWRNALSANEAQIMRFGANTDAYNSTYLSLKEKIDDYFTRCEIVAYEPTSTDLANPSKDAISSLLSADISWGSADLARLPISKISSSKELNLESGINPAYSDKIEAFKNGILKELTEQSEVLTKQVWLKMKSELSAYQAWLASKSDEGVSGLSPEEVELAHTPNLQENLLALIAKDDSVKDAVSNIQKVEKLVRLNRDLYELLTNFVSFRSFYKGEGASMFQVGTLYLDQRMCKLCISVQDAAKHAALSPFSYTYLVYCNCTRKGEAPISIAAAITMGDCDNIQVGRNGVFFDRDGKDWDATITKIVSNPISVRQAFFSPYKRFAAWVADTISKRAAAADSKTMSSFTETASDPKSKKMDIGTLAAIGVAIGGITTAFGAAMNAVFSVGILWLPVYILAAVLMISCPSMILAAMKLRQRNLGPLLDANSWAVNTKAKLNFALGATLTRPARLPENSTRVLVADPFENKSRKAPIIIAIIVLCAVAAGAYFFYVNKKNAEAKEATPTEQVAASADAVKAPEAPAPEATPAK